MITTAKTKSWGNSIGIILPQELVHNMDIVTGDEITIDIQKKENVLKKLWGAVPLKRKTKDILKDVREELEGERL